MEKSYFVGVWFTLLATIAPFAILLEGGFDLYWATAASIVGLAIGFYSLRIIHKHSNFFKGEWIVIPCIVVCSLLLIIPLLVLSFTWYLGSFEAKNISINTDEDAVKFALERVDENISDMGAPIVRRLDPAAYASAEKLDYPLNVSQVYIVQWEGAPGNITRFCSTAFSDDGMVLNGFECVLK